MKTKVATRLPAVNSLSTILPKGTEGGKEFSRIIDLLLFHEGKRTGNKTTIFNDAAGDYAGLDSLETRKNGGFGYQYKFYTSPLTDNNRKDIESSIIKSLKNYEKLKLKKWILVTPDNLLESATRKNGGDVEWFEGLKDKLKLKFDCEHWGHKQILNLFLQAPHLCLYYYPELVQHGHSRKNTIQQVRSDYDKNFSGLYKNIEFVGMSVYKPEATRGVPMEDIYIPLSVTRYEVSESEVNPPRTNPISLLRPGSKYVILGDPGSGKSTLLRFLSLVGNSPSLQKRYNAGSDDRLPILIILRRYADELKNRVNLPILEYIKEAIQADFSLRTANDDFFEYYLESGKSIICFDGLDELPSGGFKEIVRDRIRSLIITYPGNTVIVTSRIIGYEEPFKFDASEYIHYRVTRLQLPEMERFVNDWYKARIENSRERETSIQDLIRILGDQEHSAIRELAENPLLLTIVALVHRVDAVLPDERVVLYQKCTETLLNTWYTWKFKKTLEIKNRGKEERRNRRRMEAVALWMHCQGGGTSQKQRAIVPYSDLKDELVRHIKGSEKYNDLETDPIDLADEFLNFVRQRAGLLIEVGDNQYSFIHLTFQEYLASSDIITQCEMDGVGAIWLMIEDRLEDPRWHEVIRLLIAGLKAEESQEYILDHILSVEERTKNSSYLILLGGLLVDGITSAESLSEEIVTRMIKCILSTSKNDHQSSILRILSNWNSKDRRNANLLQKIVIELFNKTNKDIEAKSLLLVYSIVAKDNFIAESDMHRFLDANDSILFKGLIENKRDIFSENKYVFKKFWENQFRYLRTAPFENIIGSSAYSVTYLAGEETSTRRLYYEQVKTLVSGVGPFHDLHQNWFSLSSINKNYDFSLLSNFLGFNVLDFREKSYDRSSQPIGKFRSLLSHLVARNQKKPRGKKEGKDLFTVNIDADPVFKTGSGFDFDFEFRERVNSLEDVRERENLELDNLDVDDLVPRITNPHRVSLSENRFYLRDLTSWSDFSLNPDFSISYSELIIGSFQLEPKFLWAEAIKVHTIPNVPNNFDIIDIGRWNSCIEKARVDANLLTITDVYLLSWLIMFDIWLRLFKYRPAGVTNQIDEIVEIAKNSSHSTLKLTHSIYDFFINKVDIDSDFRILLELENDKITEMFR